MKAMKIVLMTLGLMATVSCSHFGHGCGCKKQCDSKSKQCDLKKRGCKKHKKCGKCGHSKSECKDGGCKLKKKS